MAAYKVPTYGELIRMLEVAEMEAETSEMSVAELLEAKFHLNSQTTIGGVGRTFEVVQL